MNEAVISDRALWDKAERGSGLLVEGVFSNGIYFSFPDGNLLMLHDSLYGTLPFGAAAAGLAGKGRELGVEAGSGALLSAGELSVPSAGLFFALRFCLPSVPSGGIADRFLQNAAALAVMPEDLFSRTARPALEMLERGLETNDAEALHAAVRGLVGLGRGLTPSYDDYLTGLLFSLHFAGRPAEALDHAVLAALDRTNRYSAAFLRAAAEGGHFSLPARCLSTGEEEAIRTLLSVGSSSGHDMLAGMVRGAGWLSAHKLA